jgi:LysM repeat protein
MRRGVGTPRGNILRGMPPRSPFRFLAPGALLAAIVAVLLVVSAGGDEEEPTAPSAATRTSTTAAEPRRAFYRVRAGDSLAAIASRFGVSVERLTELNPEIDPQVLQAGQRLRLRR